MPRAVCAPAMTLRFTEVRCATAHMGAALQGIFVGQGPFALPGSAGKLGSGRCGERTERCRWQRKRSERVAAVKILSVRRKAAQKFWAPQQGHRPLRKRISGCVGEGLCPSRGRGNRRSAAGGRRSEVVSRKCPDWRPQQWPGIGWHDGGQENPAPTERNKRCGAEKNPPVTASPCQAPLGKGVEGTGTDCHSQCAHWLRNDIAQGSRRLAAKNHTGGALPRLCA